MGLFVGLVSAIVRPDGRALLRVEAERLAQLLDLAAAESRLTGQSIAWTADGPGYRFWRMTGDAEWSEVRDSGLLRARALPQGSTISDLRIEGMRSPQHIRLVFNPYGPSVAVCVEVSRGAAYDTGAGARSGG